MPQPYKILVYYKYVQLDHPEQIKDAQKELCLSLDLKGRILVSTEGINGTIAGTEANINEYIKQTEAEPAFGEMEWKISWADEQVFPKLKVVVRDEIVTLGVKNSGATDEARPVLTGVLLTAQNNQITLQAADGFRLSIRKAELSSPLPRPIKAIIPARALAELARITSDGETMVTMVLPPNRGQVIFHMKDVELVSQLIEGSYPDLEQVIPRSHQTRTVISTPAILKACKQAEIFAREGTHIARIQITPGIDDQPGTVEISGQSEETGFNQTVIDANIEGNALLFAFNCALFA